MNTAIEVTIALFMITVIFHTGRLTARVEHLEEWRKEFLTEFHEIRNGIARLERLITGEEPK